MNTQHLPALWPGISPVLALRRRPSGDISNKSAASLSPIVFLI